MANHHRYSPAQCRGGRALVGVTKQHLAHVAGVRPATLELYEAGVALLKAWEIQAIDDAFMRLGVIAVPATSRVGEGVRLRRPPATLKHILETYAEPAEFADER